MRIFQRLVIGIVPILLAGIFSAGCATGPTVKQRLADGYGALQTAKAAASPAGAAGSFNQALADADAVLQVNSNGPGAAEAFYLRGRVFEERLKPNPAAAAGDLQLARVAYINAAAVVRNNPPLDGLIHEGIGNVAYHQDDYETAVQQFAAAFGKVRQPNDQAWDLYRLGLSQQRLGHWAQADETFAKVQRQFPGSEQASRARKHQGATAFYVQIPFATPHEAESAQTALRRRQFAASAGPEPGTGNPIVHIGPFGDYRAAMSICTTVSSSYPNAEVVP